ncbi:MAG: hypothetical protein DHS20C16_05720 [Phycisphaerae bacterium]|nr:MAG: hypothetical protein DHS20C16_05720 [Phycisphaerae bacterium]
MKKLTGEDRDYLCIVLPACASGDLDAVKSYAADQRNFIRWIGPHGRTMLWEAARGGRLDCVKLLFEKHSADPRAVGCYYRETRVEVSPWLIATIRDKSEVATYLNGKRAGLDVYSASYLGDGEFLNRKIARNSKCVNRPIVRKHRWNPYTAWPLQYAIAGRQPSIVAQLLAAGADASADPQILHDAIGTDQIEICEQLLRAGADPVATRHRGWLDRKKFRDLAQRFGHAIRPSSFPVEKWPALVDACRGNHNAPDDPARVAPLIGKNSDINVRDYKGKTALHRASQAGFLSISQLLIQNGADLEARSLEGETPVFDAAFYGRIEQIKFLIDCGCDLEAQNDKGETPVFAAVRGGQVDALRVLCDHDASLTVANDRGNSPADISHRSRKKGIEGVRQVLTELQRA